MIDGGKDNSWKVRSATSVLPLVLILAVGVLVALFVFYAAASQDAIHRQMAMERVESRIVAISDNLSLRTLDFAWWDALADATAQPPYDEIWLTKHLGRHALQTPQTDLLILIGQDSSPAWVSGASPQADLDPALNPSLAALITAARDRAGERPYSVDAFLPLGDRVFLASAAAVFSYRDEPVHPTGAVLILAEDVETAVIPDLLRIETTFRDMRLLGTQDEEVRDQPFLALYDPDGRVVGGLSWSMEMPGGAFLSATLPPLLIGVTLIGGLATALWLRIQRDTRDLRCITQALAERNEALALSESRYQTLARVVPTGIFWTDIEARTFFLNQRCVEIGGLDSTTLPMERWLSTIHPDDRPQVEARWVEATRSQQPVQGEYRILRPDGSIRWILVEAIPQIMPGEGSAGFVGSVTDLTAYKNAEIRLLAAQQEAENANRLKSRFFAAASHDLRQPLHAATLFAGVLEQEEMPPHQRRLIDMMGKALRSSEELLNSVLDIARLEAGAIEPSPVALTLGPLLHEIGDQNRLEAEGKGLRLRVMPCGAVIRSDPVLLGRILRNLITNAVRYTRTGRILIGCRRRGERIRVEVWDTGEGIAPEQLNRIFDEFYQVQRPDGAAAAGGLGLGLSIVLRLSRLLGHSLDVRSTPGKGSVFAIELPLAQTDPAEASGDGGPSLDGVVVGLLDHDRELRTVTRIMMEEAGATVIESDDPHTLASVMPRPPDVILFDLNPQHPSFTLGALDDLRVRFGESVPAVVLAADHEQEEAIRDAGHQSLVKPVCAAELRQVIRQSRDQFRNPGTPPRQD